MPGSADAIQGAIHALESGGAAVWVRRALVFVLLAGLALFYLLHEFRGLATSQAMDQAQIGRALLHGNGWATNFARPLAAGQLQRRGKDVARKIWIDTYNAPLPPVIDAIALLPVRSHLKMTPQEVVYVGDKMIALMSIVLFFASIAVLFLIARRLFDRQLALLSSRPRSGLRHVLAVFAFRAAPDAFASPFQPDGLRLRSGGRRKCGRWITAIWLIAVGACFGLLALAHALTIWIFLPALIVSLIYFRPRLQTAGLLLAPVSSTLCALVASKLFRLRQPAGAAIYSFFDQIGLSEAGHMRQTAIDFSAIGLGALRNKTGRQPHHSNRQAFSILRRERWLRCFFSRRFSSLPACVNCGAALVPARTLGGSGHRNDGLRHFRGARRRRESVAPSFFVPIMTCFGLAYLLVQWNRLEIENRLARIAFLSILFVLCGWPMLFNLLLAGNKASIRWPPYVPPLHRRDQ
jgi:hypothetical protein